MCPATKPSHKWALLSTLLFLRPQGTTRKCLPKERNSKQRLFLPGGSARNTNYACFGICVAGIDWLVWCQPDDTEAIPELYFLGHSRDLTFWSPSVRAAPKFLSLLQLGLRTEAFFFFFFLTLLEMFFSELCPFDWQLAPLCTSFLFEKSNHSTCLPAFLLFTSHSQQNFIWSRKCMTCLHPQIKLQIVYSLKK